MAEVKKPQGRDVEYSKAQGHLEYGDEEVSGIGTDDVVNDSSVAGATASDALDNLASDISGLDSDEVANASGVAGANVSDALDTLDAAIGGFGTDDVANDSLVPGATASDALDSLNSDLGDVSDAFEASREPTGFPNVTDSAISKVDGTQTFTIQPVGASYDFYFRGSKITKVGADNRVWPNVEGIHFFYFDASGVLQTTQSVATWISALSGGGVLVAELYWDATNAVVTRFLDERHGFMPWQTHLELHETVGARWNSGGALGAFTIGNGNLDVHAQWDCSTVSFFDEDLFWSFSDGAPQDLTPQLRAPVFYRLGVAGDWRRVAPDAFPFIYPGKGGYAGLRVPFNEDPGGGWQLTSVNTNNDYALVHLFVTNDVFEPVIAIVGQAQYPNVNDARAGAQQELASLAGTITLLAQEAAALGTVILQTSTTYGNTPKARVAQTAEGGNYVDWRVAQERGNPAPVTSHSSLSGLSDPLAHPQYQLIQGGVTGSRPAAPANYEMYFDTTLGIPIWWDGAQWVDATGAGPV